MMNTRRQALDARAFGSMLLFCSLMGLQHVAMKSAAGDIEPIFQVSLRSGIAALLVGLLLMIKKERLTVENGTWKAGVAAGVLFTLEYLVVGEGIKYTAASHVVVFLYTAPAFAALGLHWKIPSERLRPLQWLGFLLAFLGIIVAFMCGESNNEGATARNYLLGDSLALLGGVCWGSTTVVIRCSALARIPAAHTLLYQLICGFVILLLVSLLLDKAQFNFTPVSVSSMVYQTIVLCFGCFLLWFWLLTRYVASKLGVLLFMTPIFGVASGVILLDEPLETNFLIGSLLVFSGIILVSGYGWLKQRFSDFKPQSDRPPAD